MSGAWSLIFTKLAETTPQIVSIHETDTFLKPAFVNGKYCDIYIYSSKVVKSKIIDISRTMLHLINDHFQQSPKQLKQAQSLWELP